LEPINTTSQVGAMVNDLSLLVLPML